MNGVPFFAVPGMIWIHETLGRLRFMEHMGDWVLHIVFDDDPDAGPIRVLLPGSDERVMPTVPWVLTEFAEGRLTDPGNSSDDDRRAKRFMGLDRAACMARDPKSCMKHDWAMAALQEGLPRSADVLKVWVATAPIPFHPDDNDQVKRLKQVRPRPRALIRWMTRLKLGDYEIWSMVDRSGRLKGEGQLSPVLDRLIHRVAMTFIADPRLATIEDAAALCDRWWRQLETAGVPDIGLACPSMETVRLRIRSLDGRTAEEMREGKHGAKKRFDGSGEPPPVERAYERVFMDGTEFEHACLYSEDWPIASSKMKGVFAMDACYQYVFPGPVFTGPYRSEMGIQAALNIMVAPTLTADDIKADPYAGSLVGLPSDLMYDNDKAMLPPALVPSAVTAMSSVELAPVYLSDAKAKLENFFKFVKRKLRKVRGQIRGPSRLADPRYDPIQAAEVHRAQYARMVDNARREWNDKPRKAFGMRSPRQMMIEHHLAGGNRLVDPGVIRRHFASTPAERQTLTNDGLVFDRIRYRWNREGISEVLDNNHRNLPFVKRLVGTGKALVTIRYYAGDIDMIEVLDEETGKYHRMWSTCPRYTGGLSRWEHHQYCDMILAGKGGAMSEREWIALKAGNLVAFDEEMPKAAFTARENMAALMEKEDIRAKSGARASDPLFGELPEIGLVTRLSGDDRADRPAPPPQPTSRKEKQTPKPPERAHDYGHASTARVDPKSSPDGEEDPGADADVADTPNSEKGANQAPAKRRGKWDDDRED